MCAKQARDNNSWRRSGAAWAYLACLGLMGTAGCGEGRGAPEFVCPPAPGFSVTSLDHSPTFSPDAQTLAFRRGRGQIGVYLVDTTGANFRKIMDGDLFGPDELCWSPDGSRLALHFQGDIWTLLLADATLTRWTSNAAHSPRWPTWSPDGRYILYNFTSRAAADPESLAGLHILDTSTGSQRALLHGSASSTYANTPARWSHDGRTIVFSYTLSSGATYDLFLVNPDGSAYRRLTHLSGTALNPQWSGDDRTIFFDFTPAPCIPEGSPRRETWAINRDGSALRRWPVNLGNPDVFGGFPFSIDRNGSRVAFVAPDSTEMYGVINVMNIDGSGRKQLTKPPTATLDRQGLPSFSSHK